MIGYTKLFQTLVTSSVWSEDDKTRIVWITMLALANRDGIVESSLPGLSTVSRVPLKDCQAAIKRLMAPDEYSRTLEHEGRRIKAVQGGWFILNHSVYRDKMNLEERREYNRQKVAEYRARLRVRGTVEYHLKKPSGREVKTTLDTGVMPDEQ